MQHHHQGLQDWVHVTFALLFRPALGASVTWPGFKHVAASCSKSLINTHACGSCYCQHPCYASLTIPLDAELYFSHYGKS